VVNETTYEKELNSLERLPIKKNTMVTELYSKGLYSTYLYIKSLNCAFDCGEGMSTRLGPRCFGIQHLFISHGHIDHIAGIAPLVGIRSAGFGDKSTPLTIYYPKGCKSTEALKGYIDTMRPPCYKLEWVPIESGQEIKLSHNKKVRAFKVEHTNTSLGFSVIETREKLKEKYRNLSGVELRNLKLEGIKIAEATEHKLWVYSGDAYSLPEKEIEGADWLFADTTFLKKEDREEKTHSTLEEVVDVAKRTNVNHLVCMHISPRYSHTEIKDAQKLLLGQFKRGRIIPPDRFEKIDPTMFEKEKALKQGQPLEK
jgi:ribonuclease Z